MKTSKIRPIPKYIKELIFKKDKEMHPDQTALKRFYAYLTKNDGELVKMTVAVKTSHKQQYCKQVAMHGFNSERCYVKDMVLNYMGGFSVGWHEEGLSKSPSWYEDKRWGWANDNQFDPYAYIVNPNYLDKFPEFKYSCYDIYNPWELFKYLKIYSKFPIAEMLVKNKLSCLSRKVTILRLCEKDKAFRKWLIRNADEIRNNIYFTASIINAYKNNISLSESQTIEKIKKSLNDKDFGPVRRAVKGKYIRYSEYLSENKITSRQYLDYIEACEQLKIDLTSNKNLFPHDFRKWHNIRIDQYATLKAQREKYLKEHMLEKFAEVAMKYAALEKIENANFVMIIAKMPDELKAEGEYLHHCVGKQNYDQKMLREQSLIFFIRNKETPDIPLATLEYSPSQRRILQCYGDHDSTPSEKINYFVHNTWLPFANRQIKKLGIAA